jgi:hypothetical protein
MQYDARWSMDAALNGVLPTRCASFQNSDGISAVDNGLGGIVLRCICALIGNFDRLPFRAEFRVNAVPFVSYQQRTDSCICLGDTSK